MASNWDWQINDQKYEEFKTKFLELELVENQAAADVVKPILDDSGFGIDVLRPLWHLSDIDGDGYLNQAEFCIAMFLLEYSSFKLKQNEKNDEKNGEKKTNAEIIDLPKELPDELYNTRWGKNTLNNNIYFRKPLQDMTPDEFKAFCKKFFTDKEECEAVLQEFSGLSGKQVSISLMNRQKFNLLFVRNHKFDGIRANNIYKKMAAENDRLVGRDAKIQFELENNKFKGTVIGEDLLNDFPFVVRVMSKEHQMQLKTGSMRLVDKYENDVLFKLLPESDWIIDDLRKKKFEEKFKNLDLVPATETEEVRVLGKMVRPLLDSSDLDYKILSTIWTLSDRDGDGHLTLQEFMIAMFLIERCKEDEITHLDEFDEYPDYLKEVPEEVIESATAYKWGREPLREWSQKEIEDFFQEYNIGKDVLEKVFLSSEKKEYSGSDIVDLKEDDFVEQFCKFGGESIKKVHCRICYRELMSYRRLNNIPYAEKYHQGVTNETVRQIIQYKSDWAFEKAIQNNETLVEIVAPVTTGKNSLKNIDQDMWEKMQEQWSNTMQDQLKSSNFDFDRDVHRFPDIYPFEFNAMPMYIGSWMGDCFGMMQWPMPEPDYFTVLRNVIAENDVTLIIALGIQNRHERKEMVSYWQEIGDDYKKEEQDVAELCDVYNCTGIGETKRDLKVCHFPKWPDYGAPVDDTSNFDYMFALVDAEEKKGKKILIHCRAGVGRSGTFRLMYKCWKGEISSNNLIDHVNGQRARRMWTVQTQDQYNFLKKFVKKICKDRKVILCKISSTDELGFDLDGDTVSKVDPNSATGRNGLVEGWKISKVCGKEMSQTDNITDYIANMKKENNQLELEFVL